MASSVKNQKRKLIEDGKKKGEQSKRPTVGRLQFVSEKIFEHLCGNEVHCSSSVSDEPADVPNTQFLLTYTWPSDLMRKLQKVAVKNKDDWMTIFTSTVNQRESKEWYTERNKRITASRANGIDKRQKLFKKLAQKYVQEKPNESVSDAMKYGAETEAEARRYFEALTGYKVDQVGMVVKQSQPFLAASPDGIILKDMSVLEIKCPFRCKDSNIIDTKAGLSRVPYLIYGSERDVKISTEHEYYAQIQMQMYVCNVKKCHFFVYSSKDEVHLIVDRNEKFLADLIPKLEKFYFKYFLPLI